MEGVSPEVIAWMKGRKKEAVHFGQLAAEALLKFKLPYTQLDELIRLAKEIWKKGEKDVKSESRMKIIDEGIKRVQEGENPLEVAEDLFGLSRPERDARQTKRVRRTVDWGAEFAEHLLKLGVPEDTAYDAASKAAVVTKHTLSPKAAAEEWFWFKGGDVEKKRDFTIVRARGGKYSPKGKE